jgi:hypothetical protein
VHTISAGGSGPQENLNQTSMINENQPAGRIMDTIEILKMVLEVI